MADPPPFPVVVGVPRSGTTLLRFLLDAHPDLAIPPETGFLPVLAGDARIATARDFVSFLTNFPPESPGWDDFGLSAGELRDELDGLGSFRLDDAVRAFYRLYARRHGKPRAGEKTPLYALSMPQIAKLLPEAHFVHIIRDGRDVAASLRWQWFAPSREIGALARYWCDVIRTARASASELRAYREVRFEDVVARPESTLRGLDPFLHLDFHPAQLRHHERAAARLMEHRERRRADGSVLVSAADRARQQRHSITAPRKDLVGVWRREFSSEECREFVAVAGDLLVELGYPLE